MKDSVKKLLITVGVVVVFVVICLIMNLKPVKTYEEKYAGVDLEADVEGAVRQGTYTRYLYAHKDAKTPAQDAEIDLFNYQAEGEVSVRTNYEGEARALFTGSDSKVTWNVEVKEAGFYNIYMEYLIPESRGVAAERTFQINGELPFEDAKNIAFSRIWKDGAAKKIDNQGNEIRPTQVEVFDWQKAYCKDPMGYVTEPYCFYFEKGMNTLTLEAENEPMILRKLAVTAVKKDPAYAEYIAKQPAVNASATALNYDQIVQGEDSTLRSESSLYAKYDRSSPTTQPNSVTKTILNYVGGEAWRTSGQWIEWNISVPEDGFYNITIKGRQNYSRGSVSSRLLTIDGEVPFEEAKEISFDYRNDWECKTLSDENGEPYKFYLTAGEHTLRLEATLGGIGPILEDLEDCTFRLNQIYRKILVYTGATPDKYRDYDVHLVYPEVIEAMKLESMRLYKVVDDMVKFTGQKADQIATAQTLATQLERFIAKPEKITTEFTNFKDNITALGTASLALSETKLDIDYVEISGLDTKVKKARANILTSTFHELKSFVASFIVDYDAVGDVYEGNAEDVIKVWILTGRDQGTILKSMVDDSFTPKSGVKVNVEIVAPEAVLSAVMAGRGPNVILSIGGDQPVNYALRGSAVDLTEFPDYKEVFANFTESSYEQYTLDAGDGHKQIFGVPETQTFNVMFYRKDIMEELGLEVPNTWKELIEMFPTIQGNNMIIGIPSAGGSSSSANGSTAVLSNNADLSMYISLLFQYGGDMYNEKGTKTTVHEEAGVEAFSDYVKYFNDYGIPVFYDFVSRFRSGEMPIGIANYATYNTLMVSAPEIRGLWDFTLIPGTEKVDEKGVTYIDRSDFITGSASVMIPTDDAKAKQNSWEFLKWWSSTDTQVRFGREMEALLGASARYATANINAFKQLAWTADAIEVLTEQWEQTVGIREVPGGYFTGRHIANAVRKVINDKDDPRETILDYAITINEELTKKRKEFGLPVE